MIKEFYKLILVTHRQNLPIPHYLEFMKKCISSGVSCVQLREKNKDPAETLDFAKQLQELLTNHNIPLMINDNLNLARQLNAQGLHLGQSDTAVSLARQSLGTDKFIGLSIEAEHQLLKANTLDVNYVAASAIFPSQHKDNLKTFWGIEGLTKLCKQSIHPVVGIGGIDQYNLPQIMQAGAQGVAVIGALHQAESPDKMATLLRNIIDSRNY